MPELRPFAVVALISLFFAISASFPLPPASAQISSVAEQDNESLDEISDGGIYNGNLSNKPHAYLIRVRRNQYVELLITKGDLHAMARVLGPDGDSIGNFTSSIYGPLRVSFTANQAGSYRVALQSLETKDLTRHYELSVTVKSEPTQNDQKAVMAVQAFSEADALQGQGQEQAKRTAMQKYADALKWWLAADRKEDAIGALDCLARLSLALGENQNALSYYRKALLLSHQVGDRRLQTIELNNVGYVYSYLGQAGKTLALATIALRYFSRRATADDRDKHAEAAARNSAGEAHYSLGDPKKSIASFDIALALWRSVDDRSAEALAHLNLGYAYSDLGDLSQAAEHFTEALSTWREVGEQRGEGLSLTALGTVASFRGEKQKALDNHAKAITILRFVGDHEGEAAALNSIGKVYEDLNEPQTALDNYYRALEIYHERLHTDFEAVTKYYIARVYSSLGDKESAFRYYRGSLAQARQAGQQRLIAYVLIALSTLREPSGYNPAALVQIKQALHLYERLGDRRGQVNALNLIGRIYDDLGQNVDALASYRRALPLSRAAADRNAEAQTRFNIAHSEASLGRLSEALLDVKESIKSIESLRTQIVSPELRASYFASVHRHWELYIDLLMRLYRVHREPQLLATALEASESARARTLLEMVAEAGAQIREGVEPDLLRQEQNLQRRLSAKATYQMRVLAAGADSNEADEVARELRDLTIAIQDLEARIKQQSPRYATLVQPQPLNLEQIQFEVVDRNTLLLEYSLGEERSYMWAVDAYSVEAFELPSREKIERAAGDVYKLLTARQAAVDNGAVLLPDQIAAADRKYWPAAAALGAILLKPIARKLDNKRLVIVPDGTLQHIPFEALPEPAVDSNSDVGSEPTLAQPLMLRHEILSLPSASVLAAIRRAGVRAEPDDKLLAVLADPVFERNDPRMRRLTESQTPRTTKVKDANGESHSAEDVNQPLNVSRLSATRQEAQAILGFVSRSSRMMATDFDASRKTAMSPDLGHFRIVHFATHGLVDSEHPELSGLILSQVDRDGASQNGLLQLQDIYNLNLSHTQLVVLSACRTGLGKEIKGEGLVGLTRGFMYAGSPTVVASLWKVDDQATAELMKRFYRGMLEEGLTPAAALRKAKQEMWQEPQFHEPFFWAAFILQGEYRDPIRMPGGNTLGRYVLIGVICLLLFSAAYMIFRRRLSRVREQEHSR